MIIDIISLFVSAIIAITIFLLGKKLSDKEMIDRRLEVEKEAGEKLSYIKNNSLNSKVQLYNSKLIGNKYFTVNKRSIIWGYPYHGAELYDLAFDGVEFVCSIEEWSGRKYYKVGVIPYLRILKLQKNGDSSFNGPIFYVKPRIIQLDKYSIAYSNFRYYLINDSYNKKANKPIVIKFITSMRKVALRMRYLAYYKWKFLFRSKQ